MLVRLFLTALLAAGLAPAQRGGGSGEMGGGMGGGEGPAGGGMPGVRRLSKEESLLEKLKLNKDQKEEAMTILAAAREKAVPLRDLINKGRQVIVGAMVEKREDDVKRLMGEYANVSAQMTGIEAEAFGKIYALLKPNQQSRAPQAFELMAGMFAVLGSTGGTPGGAGRGRGQGGRN